MDNEDLKKLETRIDDLIDACKRLNKENRSLQSNNSGLEKNHVKTKKKTQQARAKIQVMIERLKTLERS